MGFFGRRHQREPKPLAPGDKDYIPPPLDAECPHTDLIPHWDNAADMGHTDKISAYRCESCRELFTPAQAEALRSGEAERIHELVETPEDEPESQHPAG